MSFQVLNKRTAACRHQNGSKQVLNRVFTFGAPLSLLDHQKDFDAAKTTKK